MECFDIRVNSSLMEEGEGEGAVCMDEQQPLMANDTPLESDSAKPELKRDHQCLEDELEPDLFPSKKQAKETSLDDVKSEILNPVISPKENASSFNDITSQPTELGLSTCSEGTLSDEEHSGNSVSLGANAHIETFEDDDSSKSMVVLEIPEHVRTNGIRKITFKFSKGKEDYGQQSTSFPAEPSLLNRMYDSYHDHEGYGTGDYSMCGQNMEMKMSKKVVPNNFPTNVKKLLSTGILDGARVKYISTPPIRELDGIIDGGGYLCGCSLCNYTRVLSAYEFELHAGAKTRHPNNHIYLENGKPIYNIIQELKTAPLRMMDEVIKDVAGSSVNEEYFESWKSGFQQKNGLAGATKSHVMSRPAEALGDIDSPTSYSFLHNDVAEQEMKQLFEERKRTVKRPSHHHVHKSVKKTANGSTRKRDNDLHRLLFMPNGLPDGAELAYFIKGQKKLDGYKQGNGIFCSHCETEISPSQFEAHAGMAARRQPYRHIYTSTGLTLHDIAMSLANGQSLTTGGSDDMCAVCGGGGNIFPCNGCPRAYHSVCLGLQDIPEGDWYCSNCRDRTDPSREPASGSLAKPIVIRLTRVVKAPENDIGGCVVCRGHDFTAGVFNDRTVILCDQCEREFHVGCLRNSGICDLKEIPKDKWFCCDECNGIHNSLQDFVSCGTQMIPASLCNMIQRKYLEKGVTLDVSANVIQWRILNGKSRVPEDLTFLSSAAIIFRARFNPIVAKSGRDLIPVMVYGRNISGQEFGGMHCVVLMVNSVIVSAGLVRIFGQEVAELPLVATREAYQGKGYFQALFECIEKLLCSLNVKNMVLPAAEEAESIWTKKFGFRKMSEERLLNYQRELQLTVFKGTLMLEKAVPYPSNEQHSTPAT